MKVENIYLLPKDYRYYDWLIVHDLFVDSIDNYERYCKENAKKYIGLNEADKWNYLTPAEKA